eukprot:gene11209-18373_t
MLPSRWMLRPLHPFMPPSRWVLEAAAGAAGDPAAEWDSLREHDGDGALAEKEKHAAAWPLPVVVLDALLLIGARRAAGTAVCLTVVAWLAFRAAYCGEGGDRWTLLFP